MITPKVIRYALIVGLAALIGWCIAEPANRAMERAKTDATRQVIQDMYSEIGNLARGGPDMTNPGDIFGAIRDMQKKAEDFQKKSAEKIKNAGGNPYLRFAQVMMLVGMMMGVGLALADEIGSFSVKRIGVRAAVGAGVGIVE